MLMALFKAIIYAIIELSYLYMIHVQAAMVAPPSFLKIGHMPHFSLVSEHASIVTFYPTYIRRFPIGDGVIVDFV